MGIAIGDVVEVTVQGNIWSQRCMTILHYVVANVPAQQDQLLSQADIVDILKPTGSNDIITKYAACCATNYTITALTAQYIWPVRWTRSSHLLSVAGTGISTSQTTNISAMIQKQSPLAGKKNRGAIHMPAPPNNDYNSGGFNFGLVTSYSDLANQLLNDLLEAGGPGRWDPYILHRTKPLNGTGVVWETFDVKQTIRVQRRRTVGVGI